MADQWRFQPSIPKLRQLTRLDLRRNLLPSDPWIFLNLEHLLLAALICAINLSGDELADILLVNRASQS
jgi:hypothetical protein